MKKWLVLALIITILSTSFYSTAKAEEGIAGISKTLNNIEVIYNYTTDRVNFRKEASTNSDIIITLNKRAKVQMITSSDGWSRIIYDGRVGYVNSKYLRENELPSTDFTDDEIKILQRIVEAEVTGQSVKAKANVASVIINRVLDINFPDDLESCVFQKDQFTPTVDGRYNKVEITNETKEVVTDVLKNGVTTDALYFSNTKDIKSSANKQFFNNLTFLFKDDSGHSFFK